MSTLQRYLRAFIGALRLTFSGQVIPAPPPPSPIHEWVRQYARLAHTALQTADSAGWDRAVRLSRKVRIDGRDLSLETLLTTLKFHAAEEYPSLLRAGLSNHVLNTLYATNTNDHYWLTRILQLPDLPPSLHAALTTLESHLTSVPPPADPSA